MSQETPRFVAPIMQNIVRLADDAVLLRDADRNASAFVLAIIHLEEIGKLIIRMWRHIGLKLPVGEQRDHVSKESAVVIARTVHKVSRWVLSSRGAGGAAG